MTSGPDQATPGNERHLSKATLALMPDPGTSPKCVEFANEIGLNPAGTAIDTAMVLVVETPMPWPKPVFKHPFLDGAQSIGTSSVGAVRVLAAMPKHDDTVGRIHAWWRVPTDAATRSARLQVTSNAELLELLAELEGVTPDASRFLIEGSVPERAVLICTQGSHDVCCGTEGTRLAMHADEKLAGAVDRDVEVFRVSHTGGHRFAPTAMTMPDGRMWAYLSLKDLTGVLAESVPARSLAGQGRGWWGATKGPAQVAEQAVFEHLGWPVGGAIRSVRETAVSRPDGDEIHATRWTFEVQIDDASWSVTVGVSREVPTIACRTLGGMPAKPALEYTVVNGPIPNEHDS